MKLLLNLIIYSTVGIIGAVILATILVSPLIFLVKILSGRLPDPGLTLEEYDAIQYRLYQLEQERKIAKAMDKINKNF